jgi:hypothetical protein
MSRLLSPTPWTQQPQQAVGINPSFGAVSVFNGASPLFDCVNAAQITGYNNGVSSTFEVGKAGKNAFLWSTGHAKIAIASAKSPGSSFTAVVQYENYIDNTSAIFMAGKTFWNLSEGFMFANKTNTDLLEINGGDGSTFPTISVPNVGKADGKIHTLVVQYRGTQARVAFDGRYIGAVTIGAAGAWPSGLAVGNYAGGNSVNPSRKIYMAAVVRNGDIISLSQNPWQVFQPLRRQLFVADAGGGGVTGTGSLSQSAQTLAASGSVAIGATASLSQSAQTLASTGAVAISGSASLSQSAQTLSATGTVAAAGSITGTAALNQAAQTLSATGLVAIGGTASLAQSAQTLSASGAIQITGTGNLVELAETLSASGVVLTGITGSANLTQAAQTLTATATTLFPAIGRPSSDVSNSGWSPSAGSDLFAMLDEETPSDSDYIVTSSLGSTCKLNLNATQYPGSSSQQLSLRASSSTGNGLSVTIKDGATTIATRSLTLTPSYDLHTITLTSGEIALISTGALTVELTSI